jgi:hypothetical protein
MHQVSLLVVYKQLTSFLSFLHITNSLDIWVLLTLLPEDICDLLLDIVNLSLSSSGSVGVVGVVVDSGSVSVVGVVSGQTSTVGVGVRVIVTS